MTTWAALLLLLLVGALAAPPTDTSKVISRFGFGSCNNQDEQQGIWKAVLAFKPDLWVWLGDIVYSDKKIVPFYRVPSPLSVMAQTYEKQKSGENYRALLKSNPVIGIYDDHDYGVNNGGEEYNDKEEGRKLLLRFLDEPEDSPRWQRKGAYTSYVLGPPGRSIKIIVLDTRYQRQFPSDLADMLGDEQWAWLEDQLRTTTSEINFILSSIQVLPHDKPFQEKWANFPRSRTRLLSLLMTSNVRNPIILSGDVHYGELFQFNCTDDKGKSRTLYEMTSSGMTHACAMQYPYGVCDLILQHIMKSKYSKAFYSHLNFGTVEIDWNAKPFVVTLQVRDFNGTVRVEQRIADEGKPVVLQGTGDCLDDWKRLPVLVRWRLERWVFIGLVVVASGLIVVFGFGIALLSRPKVKKSTKSKTH